MRIHRAVNNNIVIVLDENGQERILMGKGVGFRRHAGDEFDESLVDREGIFVKNVLLWETRRFYQEEFRVGLRALEIIEEKTGVRLPEDEAGFIALHIVNAQMEESAGDLYRLTKVMQEIMNIIKYSCKKPLDEESFHYCRFVTHLKFFVQRMLTHTTYQGDDSGELLAVVKRQYPQACQCTDRVGQFTKRNYGYPLSDEERLYLTIHIARILEKSQ